MSIASRGGGTSEGLGSRYIDPALRALAARGIIESCGGTVLISSPLLVASSFFLLRPLHHAQEVERKRSSELASRVTDIVAGAADPARHRRRGH